MRNLFGIDLTGKKKENAYLTLEAALVLPVFLGTMLFAIYMLLFQYNRCLMEQDLGAMALWGSNIRGQEQDTEALEEMIRERMAGMYWDKYVAWRFTEMKAEIRKSHFVVEGRGELTFPLPGWNFWSGSNVWEVKPEYNYGRLSPVFFIRLCRNSKD